MMDALIEMQSFRHFFSSTPSPLHLSLFCSREALARTFFSIHQPFRVSHFTLPFPMSPHLPANGRSHGWKSVCNPTIEAQPWPLGVTQGLLEAYSTALNHERTRSTECRRQDLIPQGRHPRRLSPFHRLTTLLRGPFPPSHLPTSRYMSHHRKISKLTSTAFFADILTNFNDIHYAYHQSSRTLRLRLSRYPHRRGRSRHRDRFAPGHRSFGSFYRFVPIPTLSPADAKRNRYSQASTRLLSFATATRLSGAARASPRLSRMSTPSSHLL